MSEELEIPIARTAESVGREAADKIALAVKLAKDGGLAFNPVTITDLIRSALDLCLDFEIGLVRQELQKEIDCRQDEILRLQAKLSAPRETLF